MRVLFLHGWRSVVGGVKPTFLAENGCQVANPPLPDEDFEESVRIAQREFELHRPEVVVGSSRGGAAAMNIDVGGTPRVLLCPAWKRWGAAKTLGRRDVVLHSPLDDVIPFADSVELIAASGLGDDSLVVVGSDHRLATPEALAAMLAACRRVAAPG